MISRGWYKNNQGHIRNRNKGCSGIIVVENATMLKTLVSYEANKCMCK